MDARKEIPTGINEVMPDKQAWGACLALCALLGTALAASGCNTPSHAEAKQKAEQRWNQVRAKMKLQLARQQFDSGLFEPAAATAQESIALDNRQADAYALLAKTHLELGKSATAEQALRTAEEKGLRSAELHFLGGVVREQRGDVAGAITEYDKSLALDPACVDAVLARAECLVAMDRAAEALEFLDEKISCLDASATAAVLAGHVADLLGDANRAVAYYAKAAAEWPQSRAIAEPYGLLLARLDRCREAVPVLLPLLVENAGDDADQGAVRRSVAACHLSIDDPVSARNVIEDFARNHPRDGVAQMILAKAAVSLDAWPVAARAASLAADAGVKSSDLDIIRATVEWRRGRLGVATVMVTDLLVREPDDADARCLLGELLLRQEQTSAAQSAFAEARRLDPECACAGRTGNP